MNEIIVEPLKKVGNVSFGMSRPEVRDILGIYKEFKKSKFSLNTTDDFGICHVFYNKKDECEAIEFFDDANLKIGNTNINKIEFEALCNILKALDENLEIEQDNCTSIKQSIGVYAPAGKVESILFGCEGYYI